MCECVSIIQYRFTYIGIKAFKFSSVWLSIERINYNNKTKLIWILNFETSFQNNLYDT